MVALLDLVLENGETRNELEQRAHRTDSIAPEASRADTRQHQNDKEQTARQKSFDNMRKNYWQKENGIVETDLRTLVQAAAQKAEFSLNSLGSVKTSKINNDLYFAEIDIQGSATIEVIAAFLSRVGEIRPALSWKRFDLRMNMRPRPGNNSSAANLELSLNGTLRIIAVGGQESAK
jgi:hypothetical protein